MIGEKPAGDQLKRDLIFDLGMHTALDTKFYLEKGFRVIAVEANPKMVHAARSQFPDAIEAGRLHIVDRALWSGDEPEVTFYVNETKDDWSSVIEGNANRQRKGVTEIRVQTLHLREMFAEYGIPYYIKCDLEGADEVFVDQLLETRQMPSYVSVEVSSLQGVSIIAKMYALGYDRMKIVNQRFNHFTAIPNPPLEGEYVDVTFSGHMSGLFGRELGEAKWLELHEVLGTFADYMHLKARDENLAMGWADVHFTRLETLRHPPQ